MVKLYYIMPEKMEKKYWSSIQLNKGADVNNEDNCGIAALFHACRHGNFTIFNYLMDYGIDINKKSFRGETLSFYARKSGNETFVKYLFN